MNGRRPTRARALVARMLVLALVAMPLAACAVERDPLTPNQRERICTTLRDAVTFAAASAVYSAVFTYRQTAPSVPHGYSLPYPDCAYLARSEHAERLEVFYFGGDIELEQRLVDRLANTGWVADGERWLYFEHESMPTSIARIDHFYGVGDADARFRIYAAITYRPGVVVSITSRIG